MEYPSFAGEEIGIARSFNVESVLKQEVFCNAFLGLGGRFIVAIILLVRPRLGRVKEMMLDRMR